MTFLLAIMKSENNFKHYLDKWQPVTLISGVNFIYKRVINNKNRTFHMKTTAKVIVKTV